MTVRRNCDRLDAVGLGRRRDCVHHWRPVAFRHNGTRAFHHVPLHPVACQSPRRLHPGIPGCPCPVVPASLPLHVHDIPPSCVPTGTTGRERIRDLLPMGYLDIHPVDLDSALYHEPLFDRIVADHYRTEETRIQVGYGDCHHLPDPQPLLHHLQ